MDPASAIGVASAAITFLDFSIDVCKISSQIITSDDGVTKHNAEVEATVKRHKEATEALKTKSASATSLQLGPDISRVVDESITDSAELLALVERLRQAKDASRIGPLKAVYLSMRCRERIERLRRKAENGRSVITQGLIQATWETNALHHESSAKAFQSLDKQATDLLEALRSGNSDVFKDKAECTLVRSHSDCADKSDLQHETLNFKPGEGAWVTVANADHYFEITKFFGAEVSFMHRSVYDFFFAPDDWNSEHVKLCRSLLEQNEKLKVHAKLQAGLRKLLWIEPLYMRNTNDDKRWALPERIAHRSNQTVHCTIAVGNANSLLNKDDLTSHLDDILSSMRLELLLSLVKAPIIENREHVPGDIFSHQLLDGCLLALDEDKLLCFESFGPQEDLRVMANFEANFLYDCAWWETLHDYIHSYLGALHRRAIAPLVQASLMRWIADHRFTEHFWSTGRSQVLLLKSVQRWVPTLVRTRTLLDFHKFVWRCIVRLVPGYIDSLGTECPQGTSFSVSDKLRNVRSQQF